MSTVETGVGRKEREVREAILNTQQTVFLTRSSAVWRLLAAASVSPLSVGMTLPTGQSGS